MTIFTPEPHAYKRASQALSKLGTGTPLLSVQDTLARATGHRDRNHLKALHKKLPPQAPPAISVQWDIVHAITNAVSGTEDVVLDILMRTRFFGSEPDPQVAFSIREHGFSKAFSTGNLFTAGTPCELAAEQAQVTDRALVVRNSTSTNSGRLMGDWGMITCTSDEITKSTTEKFFIPLRFWLPYGRWTEPDGTAVLFSRDYYPLWRIEEGKAAVRDDPHRQVPYIDQEWLITDDPSHSNIQELTDRSFDTLRQHRVVSTPRLVEWLPYCLEAGKSPRQLKTWPTSGGRLTAAAVVP